MTGRHRRLGAFSKLVFLSGLLLALLTSLVLWYTTTPSFERRVRRRLIVAIERASGGRAELSRFRVVPFRFQVEIEGLTIHGREQPGDVPLTQIDRVSAVVNLRTLLGGNFGFHSLALDHPVIHLIWYADGSSNRPRPQPSTAANFEHLFSISIDKLSITRGELLWQDHRIPLNFALNDLTGGLDYSFLRREYSGTVSLGHAETHLSRQPPVVWAGQSAFTIGQDKITFQGLKLSAAGSWLEARGELTNFNDPHLTADYNLALNLLQAGAILGQSQLKAGRLDLAANASWATDNFLCSGRFAIAGLSWKDSRLTLNNASAGGKFSLNPSKLTLSQVQGLILGGSFTSEVEMSGWQSVALKKNPGKNGQSGSIKVRIKEISLAELMASLAGQSRAFTSVGLRGSVWGAADLRWKNAIQDAELSLGLNVSPPGHTSPNEIPVNAIVNGTYNVRNGDATIRELFLSTPASSLRATGTLARRGLVRLALVNSDPRELRPLIAALFPARAPLLVNSRTAFSGTVAGRLTNPSIVGTLEIADADAVFVPGRARPIEPIHCDLLKSDIQLSAHAISLRNTLLKSMGATLRVEGNAQLVGWKLVPESLIRFVGKLDNGDAAQVARMLAPTLKITGRLRSDFDFTGSISRPVGRATIALSGGSIETHAFDAAHASLALSATTLVLNEFDASRGSSAISGSGHVELVGHHFEFHLTGKDFDLAQLSLPNSSFHMGGRVDFSAQAAGTPEQPDVKARLELRNLSLNQQRIGDYSLDAVTHGAELHLTGHSTFESAELSLDGNVRLRERWPAAIDFHFHRLDIDSFLSSYLRGHLTGHSAVAGDLRLEGPLLEPGKLNWLGNLSDVHAEVEKIKLRNDGPLRFVLAGQVLKLSSFHVVGENTDVSAKGSLEVAGARDLDLDVNGKIGLGLIENYDPDFTASGLAIGQAHILGTLDAPIVEGKLRIENGSIADVNLPSGLGEMNGELRFSQNQITIAGLEAHTGGGSVSFTGHAELVGRQINFDLNTNVDAVRLRYPPGVSSTANATLHWTGSSSGSLLSGDIMVIKLGVTPGFDFGAYLERSIQQSSLPQTDPVLNRIRLDLHVVTAPELQMQTSVLRLRGEADLHVRGNAAKPVLLGRGDVFEGEAYFNGTKYRLERGGVSFTNPAITTPFVDLEAVTHVRDYDIMLSLTGDVSKPNALKMSYRSEPPLPTADIISLLAFGQTSETSAQLQQTGQSAFSQQASSAMLAAALNATLNNRAQRLFGNSRIKIDPQGLETETSPTQSGPAVTIEQQVKDNLTLSYTTNVSQTSQQIIRAEYNVSRNLSIVAIRDQNGVVSFDVKIRRRKR